MKFLSDLIGINTYEGNYREIIDLLVGRLEAIDGCQVHIQEIGENKANVVGIFGEPDLLINCHMDTVKPSKAWSQDPLHMYQKDGRIYGLGACDTKGNIYMVIKALEEKMPKNLMVLFSVDEESGIRTGVKYFLESQYAEGIKRAIVCEPTELKLVSRHRGYYSFTLEDIAESAHSSTGAKGAIIKAAHNVIKLDELGFNVGIIQGGSAGNVVSSSCTYRTSIRTFDGLELVVEKIKDNCPGTRIENRFNGPPLINEDPKFEGQFHQVDFWTEGSLFQEAGINTVVFGAGSIDQAHSEDEFVEGWQLEKGIGIIKDIIDKK